MQQSDKILAMAIGILLFLVFRNWKIGHNRVINTIASTTFGVLLIHANSDAMRQWLWRDFLCVPSYLSYPIFILIWKSAACVIGIFVVCSFIELFRIKYVEKCAMKFLGL